MTIDLHRYRQTLLSAVHAIRATQPAARIHLIYTPELKDPLGLAGDTRRDTAFLQAPARLQVVTADQNNAPRLLTLDCRRVASYLLESDPGLDDPAFEHSITQAHAESCLAQFHNSELNNDERELSDCAIGGWLISSENALTLAGRLRNFSCQQGAWLRWTNPSMLSALWPSMTSEQRFAMLGDATWLAFDGGGVLHSYAGDAGVLDEQSAARVPFMPQLDSQQIRTLKNVPLVRDLVQRWGAMLEEQGEELPASAERELHAHVCRAQDVGLDAESVSIYVMTAVQLKQGATEAAEWTKLVCHVAHEGLALRDMLETLSDPFWECYGNLEPEAGAR